MTEEAIGKKVVASNLQQVDSYSYSLEVVDSLVASKVVAGSLEAVVADS